LLLEANRHSPGPERDLSREVHKAEWRIKEQKLKEDIRGLREKLTGLVRRGRGCQPGRGRVAKSQ
jgi:CAP-Gly domain-containing linker protein 2